VFKCSSSYSLVDATEFKSFLLVPFSQPHSGAKPVLVDEFPLIQPRNLASFCGDTNLELYEYICDLNGSQSMSDFFAQELRLFETASSTPATPFRQCRSSFQSSREHRNAALF
jgi:hypothetical protein